MVVRGRLTEPAGEHSPKLDRLDPNTGIIALKAVLQRDDCSKAAERERESPRPFSKKLLVPGHPPEPAGEHNLAVDMTVVGRVIKSHDKGANIQLLDDPRIIGYMMIQDGPFVMRDTLVEYAMDPVPVGLVREFTVNRIPEDMEYYGKGPLLACKYRDASIMWHRAEQAAQVLEEGGPLKKFSDEFTSCKDREVINIRINGANNGGLLSAIDGLPAFAPFSLVTKDVDKPFVTLEETRAKFVGNTVPVTIREVSRADRKVTVNLVDASQILAYRNMKVGGLVSGSVRRIEAYGVLIGIDDTRISALLHISATSRAHIENMFDIFQEGERVRCMIERVDYDAQRINLNTADLEEIAGDMLMDKKKVYEGAEGQLAAALERLARRQEEQEMYGDDQRSERRDDLDFNGDFRR